MELKDMILSTLAEIEDDIAHEQESVELKESIELKHRENPKEIVELKEIDEPKEQEDEEDEERSSTFNDEKYFCEGLKERILVLFEGLQAPNNKSIEAKVDLTLNFLEYSLAVLDERLEKLEKR